MKRTNLFMKILDISVIIATGFLFLLQLCRMFSGGIDADDFEHLSSAWWMFNGYIPYRDFFQFHHPLLWYLIQPFFHWVDHPIKAFLFLRLFGGFCFLTNLWTIYLIVCSLKGSWKTTLYTFLVYLSYPMLFGFYIEGRPDIPMMSCLLLGVYFLIRFLQDKKRLSLIFSYAFLFLSFAFLQKVVLFLFPFGIYQLYLLYKKKLLWKDIGLALIFPVATLTGYAFYLYQAGILWRYIELNWILNLYYSRGYQMYHLTITIYDWIYHLLFATFLLYGVWQEKGLKRQLLILLSCFVLLFFFIPKPYNYYYSLIAPFMAIVMGFGFKNIKEHFKIPLILFCLIGASHSFFTRLDFDRTPIIYPFMDYFKDLETLNEDKWIDYAAPTIFSLYQSKPRQYYWFNKATGALWDMHLFHRYQNPNWNDWIYQTKPSVIIGYRIMNYMHTIQNEKTNVLMQLDSDFLQKYYLPPETKYKIYRLKQSSSE